ncbi:MAG TPA: hypothetical protein PKY59_17250 [Pyrinomonadaceae bacterium]|nr:hypothetical protein [Pyrinomonadaceae bacterium]
MPRLIPQNSEGKIVFFEIFKKKFIEEAENLNFNEAETEKVVSACDTIVFSIKFASGAKQFSKAAHIFRKAKLSGNNNRNHSTEFVPEFIVPELPAVMFPSNAIAYLQRIFKRIKAQETYSETLGIALGIVPQKAAPRNNDQAKPKGNASALPNNVVRVDWRKGKFDGVIVYSKRGGETSLSELSRDIKPPFIDTRLPLEAGKPEVRQYQLWYMIDDKPVGKGSDIFTAVTTP